MDRSKDKNYCKGTYKTKNLLPAALFLGSAQAREQGGKGRGGDEVRATALGNSDDQQSPTRAMSWWTVNKQDGQEINSKKHEDGEEIKSKINENKWKLFGDTTLSNRTIVSGPVGDEGL